MPLAAALICNSRDDAGGVDNQNGAQVYLASASKGVDVVLGRSAMDMKLKE
jgi:hypothetical protein